LQGAQQACPSAGGQRPYGWQKKSPREKSRGLFSAFICSAAILAADRRSFLSGRSVSPHVAGAAHAAGVLHAVAAERVVEARHVVEEQAAAAEPVVPLAELFRVAPLAEAQDWADVLAAADEPERC
jgi:hypothetical protein